MGRSTDEVLEGSPIHRPMSAAQLTGWAAMLRIWARDRQEAAERMMPNG